MYISPPYTMLVSQVRNLLHREVKSLAQGDPVNGRAGIQTRHLAFRICATNDSVMMPLIMPALYIFVGWVYDGQTDR